MIDICKKRDRRIKIEGVNKRQSHMGMGHVPVNKILLSRGEKMPRKGNRVGGKGGGLIGVIWSLVRHYDEGR